MHAHHASSILLTSALVSIALGCSSADRSAAAGSHASPTSSALETTEGGSAPAVPAAGFFGLQTSTLEGEPAPLAQYAGQVALVVNVASECGYTPQYAGLQELYATYEERGLVVLGFPSNEFGRQEPGDAAQIRAFCSERYGVSFPLFVKQNTQPGPEQSDVYRWLFLQTERVPGWNFCKYLVARDGRVLGFWTSRTAPDDPELLAALEAALGS